MARAIDPRQTFEYTLIRDRKLPDDAPDKTVWIMRCLTSAEEARIGDNLTVTKNAGESEQEVKFKSSTAALETLRLGLQGWRKLPDENGDPVEFKGLKVGSTNGGRIEAADADLDRIFNRDRNELANAITTAGRLTPDEVGKS